MSKEATEKGRVGPLDLRKLVGSKRPPAVVSWPEQVILDFFRPGRGGAKPLQVRRGRGAETLSVMNSGHFRPHPKQIRFS